MLPKLIYTLGNDKNPMNGEIRTEAGELIVLRAVTNEQDDALMKAMAGAPELLATAKAVLALIEQDAIDVKWECEGVFTKACADLALAVKAVEG